MCYWKQWRYARTKIRHLLKLGISKRQAIMAAQTGMRHHFA